jgi:hypothetical protein
VNRITALAVSVAVAVSAAAGAFALTSTLAHGTEARASTDAVVAARTKQLDRFEASLRASLAQKPPALPALPALPPAARAAAPADATAPAAVVYRQAPPIVKSAAFADDDGGGEDGEHAGVEHAAGGEAFDD